MPTPPFPFSDATPWYPSVPTPWLGGMVVPISGGTGASANRPVDHGLGRMPRFAWLLDAWTNVNVSQPLPRGTTPWTNRQAFFNMPSLGQRLLLFFG